MDILDIARSADQSVLRFFQSFSGGGLLDGCMVFLSVICDHGEIWLLTAVVLLCFKKTRKAGLAALISISVSFLCVEGVIKPLIGRPRPYITYPDVVPLIGLLSSGAFPSGHAAQSIAFTAPLVYDFKGKAAPFVLLALLIAFSRIYLCVHYLSDVIGGVVTGAAIGALVVIILNKKRAR